VSETILTLRWLLVSKIIKELQSSVSNDTEVDNIEILTGVKDYNELANIFSKKLGRVISRHN
jgi:DNA primase